MVLSCLFARVKIHQPRLEKLPKDDLATFSRFEKPAGVPTGARIQLAVFILPSQFEFPKPTLNDLHKLRLKETTSCLLA